MELDGRLFKDKSSATDDIAATISVELSSSSDSS